MSRSEPCIHVSVIFVPHLYTSIMCARLIIKRSAVAYEVCIHFKKPDYKYRYFDFISIT